MVGGSGLRRPGLGVRGGGRLTPALLARLVALRAAGTGVVTATRLADGAQSLWPEDALSPPLAEAARTALSQDRSATITVGEEAWFLHAHPAPLRLFVVGAVHIAQALVPMAGPLAYAVTVIDPRRAFATEERFAGVALSHEWPDEALDRLRPDARTAIVTLTHDPKIDDPALDRGLRSDAAYLGALGSRRTHAGRCERLAALGHDAAAIARVRGPVGLPIGAVSAAEIALSIMAEIVSVRRGGRATS